MARLDGMKIKRGRVRTSPERREGVSARTFGYIGGGSRWSFFFRLQLLLLLS